MVTRAWQVTPKFVTMAIGRQDDGEYIVVMTITTEDGSIDIGFHENEVEDMDYALQSITDDVMQLNRGRDMGLGQQD